MPQLGYLSKTGQGSRIHSSNRQAKLPQFSFNYWYFNWGKGKVEVEEEHMKYVHRRYFNEWLNPTHTDTSIIVNLTPTSSAPEIFAVDIEKPKKCRYVHNLLLFMGQYMWVIWVKGEQSK
jgi:hypothetical protein